MKRILITVMLTAIVCNAALAQVAINTTNAAPNSSAMLDITSTTKGLLIPRMDSIARKNIASPATGLLVYQTGGSPGFITTTAHRGML